MKIKTKKIIRIVCAILLIIALQALGYTYAKYITEEKGIGCTEVAKWAFKIDKGSSETKEIKLENIINPETLVDGKIAPGTAGTIQIVLDGTGAEVGIDYDVKFKNEKNKPTNLTFIYNGVTYKSLSEINTITGNIPYNDENRTREIIIPWRWEYENGETSKEIATNDEIDTQDANTISEFTFELVATGTQSN